MTLNYRTLDGTATAGQDYIAAAGIVTVPGGVTRALIPLQIICDATA